MASENLLINNINISYKQEGTGQPVIFLHGWGQDKESFQLTSLFLSDEYTCYSLDLPGFGDSQEPTQDYDLRYYSDIVEEFIIKLNLHGAYIVSHSFGSRIVVDLASRGKITNKLVITGGAGIKPKHRFNYQVKVYNYKFLKLLTKSLFYNYYKDDLLSNSGSIDYRQASTVMKKVLINVVNLDLKSKLELIENEVLLYWGEKDQATPLSDGKTFEKFIKNSNLIVKEKLTHFAFLEDSNDFNQQILTFFQGRKV